MASLRSCIVPVEFFLFFETKKNVTIPVLCAVVTVAGCTSVPSENTSHTTSLNTSSLSVTTGITEHPDFKDVVANITKDEFMKKGFEYRDSLDVAFSNGKIYRDVPLVSSLSMRDGTIVVYTTIDAFAANRLMITRIDNDSLYQESGVKAGDTVTISLNSSGKYLNSQKLNTMVYSKDRSDPQYSSDEQFGNFRAMSGGNLKENLFYRGASSIDNALHRAPIVNTLMKKAGIKAEINLADAPEHIATMQAAEDHDAPYFDTLYESGRVIPLGLGLNYHSSDFSSKLAGAFVNLTSMDGPFYVHCLEGKERAGFVSMIIEALAGATYAEIEADFMKSYDNYYNLTKTSDSDLYNQIKDIKLDDKIRVLSHLGENADVSNVNLQSMAVEYLKDGGMTDAQIDAFIKKITK